MLKKTHWMLTLLTALMLAVAPLQAKEANGPAPDFTLKSRDGGNVKLSELAGNVVMVNFWASWCAPCRVEMPKLNQLYNKYKDLGFVLLGVNVEEQQKPPLNFLQKRPVDFPILWDNRNEVSKKYKVIAMPTTVLVDRSGNIRYIHQGYKEGDEKKYRKIIKKLLRE